VVVALRADFYGRFAVHDGLAELLGGNQVLVGPMQASELRRAVELPAARVGLRVEPALADALVDDVEGEPGALPLLSTALLELWQNREDDALTLAAYRESGGVHGAVARLAETTYARVPDERKPSVRAIMLRLVGEDETEVPVRRRAPLAELDLEHNEDVAGALSILSDSRLVAVSEGHVEVAHEALLQEWPRLREWIEEDAEGRRLRRHITQAAMEWDADGRDTGELYRGARLAAALDWSTDHAFELNELEREFVGESREASEQETRRVRLANRRLRGLLVGVGVLLAAAVAGGVFAVIQRGEARSAETGQLAQRLGAQALVEEDLDRSLLLARQAVALDDSPQTRSYLFAALQRVPAAIRVLHAEGVRDYLRALAVTPDGRTLAVGSESDGVLFFDTRTYERVSESLPVPAWVESLAYSPDGKTLAYGGNRYLRLVDARTHELLARARMDGVVSRIVFTEDGKRIVVRTGETGPDSIGVRDAATLAPMAPPIEPEGFSGAYVPNFWVLPGIALVPGGRSLIVASDEDELVWWDLASRRPTRRLQIGSGLHALALSADGETVAVGIEHGIQLVNVRSGGVRTAAGALGDAPSWLLFSADGRTVVSTGDDGTVGLWDVRSATLRETFVGHSRAVQQPVFSPDGKSLYTASHDGTVIGWDVSGNRRLGRPFTFTHERLIGPDGERHPGSFSPGGKLIAVGLKNRGIRLFDSAVLRPVGAPLTRTGGEVQELAFTPDGTMLIALSIRGLATIWDVDGRSLVRGPFRVARGPMLGIDVVADGTMFATAGPNGVALWDVATGRSLGRIGGRIPVGDVAFDPTGSRVAFIPEGWDEAADTYVRTMNVEIWDVVGRSRVTTLKGTPGDTGGYAVAFTPDGRTLASGGITGDVSVWDVHTGRLVHRLEQGSAGVLTLDFSADGRTLAVSGHEPVASLWDVATGAQIGLRLTAGARRTEVDLSPDGRRLLQTHGTGQGAVWDVDPESWAERACALANRTLTPEEWERFLPGRSYEPACS
jgi:WD40 repeat protein